MSYWDWGYYKPKPRKQVKGGIKAQSKRGDFGASWWAKRWIAVLESFNIGARLSRGRSYARSGQVLALDIQPGTVKAKVQGSSSQPYKITIQLKTLTAAEWQTLAQSLATQAIFAAKLLAGEMPQEIEQAFTAAGLSLFPAKLRDLTTDCSCPDWSNPCKHIAAAYYLLGEEFDRDPFLLFKLRGMERAAFLKLLGAATPGSTQAEAETPALPPEPLAVEATAFWQGLALPEEFWGEVRTPPVNAAVLQRLGKFPFWRGAEDLREALSPTYTQAAQQGLDVFLGTDSND
ncbi:MAG TPA: SWIM zinc finger family protein [Blastocatellia bacterium]|nr:SWIM zinc finger family protein [Blastocatellia bacterium]